MNVFIHSFIHFIYLLVPINYCSFRSTRVQIFAFTGEVQMDKCVWKLICLDSSAKIKASLKLRLRLSRAVGGEMSAAE